MSAVPKAPYISPEEYLALERESEIRHEYFRGEMFAMSGGTRVHSLIATNLIGALWVALDGLPCEPHGSDMRIKISATGLYTYPDVSVVCGEPGFDDGRKDTLLNPVVVAEVLSPKTEAYDRGDKFANYRRIESLREYILISQDRVLVERFVRHGEEWLLTEINNLEESLRLDSIGCQISVRSIYKRVEFPPPKLPSVAE
jgi:Uma2 family endonuclease